MKNYKTMKVFDCQWNPGMPQDVQDAFFSFYECGNDVYVSWTIEKIPNEDDVKFAKEKMVNTWLIENGACEGETVLIQHWW
jgi:hypothetical protein